MGDPSSRISFQLGKQAASDPTTLQHSPDLPAQESSRIEARQPETKIKKRVRYASPVDDASPRSSMAEPATKRARRTDSAAMWDSSNRDSKGSERESKEYKSRGAERDRGGRYDDSSRTYGRDDRRRRSRSRDAAARRRERSRSRDRDEARSRGGRDRNGRDARDRKDRERSVSRERHRSRRGEF